VATNGAIQNVHEVTPEKTEVSIDQLRSALSGAYTQLTGKVASKPFLDILTAQARLETGNGQHMWNYNFSGIKGAGPEGMTAKLHTHEILGGKDVEIVDGFRAYSSLQEGATDYVHLLQHQFHAALDCAQRGDVDGFAHQLRASGYYTASEQDYSRALHSITGGTPHAVTAQSAARGAEMSLESASSPGANASQPLTTEMIQRMMDALTVSASSIANPDDDRS
jgi:flagellum-specific peptidoglycan hydrolase FlgJ